MPREPIDQVVAELKALRVDVEKLKRHEHKIPTYALPAATGGAAPEHRLVIFRTMSGLGTGSTEFTFDSPTYIDQLGTDISIDGSDRLYLEPGVYGFAGMMSFGGSGGSYRGVEMYDDFYLVRTSTQVAATFADARVPLGGVWRIDVAQNFWFAVLKDIGSSAASCELMVSKIADV